MDLDVTTYKAWASEEDERMEEKYKKNQELWVP